MTGETTAKDGQRIQLGKTVQFDIDGDGAKDTIEWMAGDGDGLVVDMTKIGANGEIDGNALMGDQGGKHSDGYAKLSTHDANGDGKLSGAELQNMGVWVDDGDAKLEADELKSAADAGLTELSAQRNNLRNEKGETLMRSTATVNGQDTMSEDVWFGKRD